MLECIAHLDVAHPWSQHCCRPHAEEDLTIRRSNSRTMVLSRNISPGII